MEKKNKTKKKLAYFVASPNRCQRYARSQDYSCQQKKHMPQDTIFICNFYKNYLQVY